MPINKQFVTVIKKSLTKFDFSKLEEKCTNEAQTIYILVQSIVIPIPKQVLKLTVS